MPTKPSDDQCNLAWHAVIVQHMRERPALLAEGLSICARWTALGPREDQRLLDEWSTRLRLGIESVEEVAFSTHLHATLMRRSSPIAHVLGPAERQHFWQTWTPSVSDPVVEQEHESHEAYKWMSFD